MAVGKIEETETAGNNSAAIGNGAGRGNGGVGAGGVGAGGGMGGYGGLNPNDKRKLIKDVKDEMKPMVN
jgi:hypothetical protein